MVLNSMGVPPAARMPSFTLAESRRRWKLQGMVSIQVLATRDQRLGQVLVGEADAPCAWRAPEPGRAHQ